MSERRQSDTAKCCEQGSGDYRADVCLPAQAAVRRIPVALAPPSETEFLSWVAAYAGESELQTQSR